MQSNEKPIKNIKIEYKGILCDCLLEAKYILTIENGFSFLRHPTKIFYDPATLQPTSQLTENPHYYHPDFLVRRWSDDKAFLVEVKDLQYEGAAEKLQRSEIIANNFIREKGYDWSFQKKLAEEIEAQMTPEQLRFFMQNIRNTKDTFDYKRRIEKMDMQFRTSYGKINKPKPVPAFIKGQPVTLEQLKLYLWKGELPEFLR